MEDIHLSNLMMESNILREAKKLKNETMKPDIPRILLIGKAGSGKSTLGNNLIGSPHFVGLSVGVALTKEPETCIASRNVLVVDTPGLFDTKVSSEQVEEDIRRCIGLMSPGPHVILHVIRIGRFTKEDIRALATYSDMFGEDMYPYTIVVFVRFDSHWNQIESKTKVEALEDFRKSFPETVEHFLKRIKNRYIMLDTKGKDVEDETKTLIFAIEQMITANKNGFYSYQHFIESKKSQLRAEGLVADENRRQKKKKNRRKLTSSFLQKNSKRTRSSFEREPDVWMVPLSKKRCNRRA